MYEALLERVFRVEEKPDVLIQTKKMSNSREKRGDIMAWDVKGSSVRL